MQAIGGKPIDKAFPYLLLIPALLIGFSILLFPLINGLILSFTNYTLLKPEYGWKGLQHYRNLFQNKVFWEVYSNSLIMVFSSVAIQFFIGFSMALLLNAKIRMQGLFRGFITIIWIIPEIVTALLFVILYNKDFGIFNYLLTSLQLVKEPVSWLGEPVPAKLALIFVYGWRGVPFHMVMLLAALQTVPHELEEAAIIDGANRIKRFLAVTIPSISHIIALCWLLSIVRAFQDVTQIMTLTKGGPIHSTTTLAIHVYNTAFTSFDMGKAAAVGVTWMLFLIILSIFYIRIISKGEDL
jgi:multiple sugar transport system permease protein